MFFNSNLVAGVAAILSIVSVSTATQYADPTRDFGYSPLGTLAQKPLPKFLKTNPLPGGYPWGLKDNNDPPKNPPNTGVTRFYHFAVSRGMAAPDGFLKEVLLVNGQFPGPLIEANWGDWIQVTVKNKITAPEEGTSIHWHGLLQKESPWMDGVPSVTQCPIAPGSTFTYRFRADIYGTSWYHSHYSTQLVGGLFGPIVIYGPTHTKFDEDLGIIALQDYFHIGYRQLLEDVMSTNTTLQVQYTDNTLINGRMPFNCSTAAPGAQCNSNAPYSKFRVQTGKTYKLRLVNTGAGSIMYFSIDNHNLTIIANDFVDIIPYEVTQVALGAGQRSDVLFTPKGNGTIWMRSQIHGRYCGRSRNPEARAVILLNNAPENSIPTTTAWPPPVDDFTCGNNPLNMTVPYYPMPVPKPSITYNIVINQIINSTGHKLFTMNGSPFYGDYNDPVLLLAEERNYSYPYDPKWNVVNFGSNTSIRVNVWNNNTNPHPMHLHGHDFYMLHDGPGQWDGVSIVNPQNPQRRDTQNLAPNGHMVFQFDADNPGMWAFHCHIATHISQGLYMTFMERPEDIKSMEIPLVMAETCTNWDEYTSKNVVDQIDSGLKKRELLVRKAKIAVRRWTS